MKKLPYRAVTGTGDTFDIEFPLHRETVDAVRIAQIISALLDAIDKDIAIAGDASNGDVLQAVAMAMAVRAGMIHAPQSITQELCKKVLASAMDAVAKADRGGPTVGHA